MSDSIKDKAAVNALCGIILIFIGVPFFFWRNMLVVGIVVMTCGFFVMIYYAYKYARANKDTSNAAVACVTAAAAVIILCIIAIPEASEEIEEGGIIVPTYSATVEIEVDNVHLLVGKDYELKMDDKTIATFHLKAWETHTITKTIKWMKEPTKIVKFTVSSTGAAGIGDYTDTKTAVLTDGKFTKITLEA